MAVPKTDLPTDVLTHAQAELETRIRNGQLHTADDLKADFPTIWNNPEARLELIYSEYVLRTANGEQPRRQDWFDRYPDLHERLERLFGLYDLMAGDTHRPATTVGAERPTQEADADADHPTGYEILGELGRGGMSVVYRARHLELNRVVALKVLRWGDWDAADDTRIVRREAEMVARLQHPNIVQVFEVGEWDGDPFLALEYLPGGTLADALNRFQRQGQTGIGTVEAARLVGVLAAAVQAAHEQGVVHRDLKSANVLLADDPTEPFANPKITDFGLAVSTELSPAITQTATVAGTPCYMAPEQSDARRAIVGPRTDVYALGGILYELLTGRPPFQGATVLETLDLVRHTEPTSPRQLRPNLPRDLETICLKCLAKDPPRRYQSAALLAEDLARFQEGKPINARPVGQLEKGWKWCRRQPLVAGMLCGLVAAVGVAVVLPSVFWKRAEDGRVREVGLREAAEVRETRLRMKTARLQWLDSDLDAARESLAGCNEWQRDAEWKYLWRMCRPPLTKLQMEPPSDPSALNGVAFVEYSPCGQAVAVVRADGRLRMWDASTGVLARSWAGGTGKVPTAFSQLAVGSSTEVYVGYTGFGAKSKSYIWSFDLATGSGGQLWEIEAPLATMAFSDNGRFAAYLSKGTMHVLDLAARKEKAVFADLFPQPTGGKYVFAANGRYLATYMPRGNVKVWDAATTRLVHEITPPPEEPLATVASVSSDGEWVAYVTIRPQVRKQLYLRTHVADRPTVIIATDVVELLRVRFSPDGKTIAASSKDGGIVSVWDAVTGREVVILRGQRERVFQFAYSPDSKRLALGDSGGRVAIWDVTADEP